MAAGQTIHQEIEPISPPKPFRPHPLKKFRPLHAGMGQAVAERTILRRKANGELETWADVANRVALGNSLLCKTQDETESEYKLLRKHISNGTLLMSGRHLQHGDATQPERTQEIFSNCATSSTSFLLFLLLMSGSGVGRCYDDDLIVVNWDNAPTVRCVLSEEHPDYNMSAHESVRDAKHKYNGGANILWHEVQDTREGWAKALELWENAAFEKIHRDKMLILDFSKVRPRGAPIMGMQGRPSSGPVPLMNAFQKANTLKGANLRPWQQALYIDHYFAECVLVGGARRSARWSGKYWKDDTIIDFINIKRPIEYAGLSVEEIEELRKEKNPFSFLWSSNNSVLVDSEFWDLLSLKRGQSGYTSKLARHARQVFKALTKAAYGDGTGEPGIVNVDKLVRNDEGWDDLNRGDYIGSRKYQVNDDTQILLSKLAKRAKRKKYNMIVNPCVTGDTWIQTSKGPRQVQELIGKSFYATVNGQNYFAKNGFWKTGEKQVFQLETDRGYSIRATGNHKILTRSTIRHPDGQTSEEEIWKELKDISVNDRVVLQNHRPQYYTPESEDFYQGKLLGYTESLRGAPTTSVAFSPTITSPATIPLRLIEKKSPSFTIGFITWLFDTCGEVQEKSILFKLHSKQVLGATQRMLLRLGIASTISEKPNDMKLIVEEDNVVAFSFLMQSCELSKAIDLKRLEQNLGTTSTSEKFEAHVSSIRPDGQERVYDCSVEDVHCFDANGITAHNCGEVNLCVLGGFCVIADLVPFHADTVEAAIEAARAATRALIRVNTMDSIYSIEVKRTNRIGVSLTGVHEFAWKFFKLGFKDLIDEEKAKPFWHAIARIHRAVREEAISYSKKLGMVVPHTFTVVKPSGSVSKLYGLTEGWHLPPMAWFLRWVQFRSDDPLVQEYKDAGCPVRENLEQYRDTSVVGFPTAPTIASLGMSDKLVTAGEATIEEQYRWLQLGEKYWVIGVDENGTPLKDQGGQISCTIKYNPDKIEYSRFVSATKKYQPTIKCCSVMPQVDTTAYEYQPEQPLTKAEYEEFCRSLSPGLVGDIDIEHIECEGGACPVDYKENKA